MAVPYDPNFRMSVGVGVQEIEEDLEHDASASAAVVAVDLISTRRFELKLDSVRTEYSAQYLVDNARPKKKGGNKKNGCRKKKRGPMMQNLKLTVKDCLEFALRKGIPKAEDWPPLGSLSKPPSSYKPALVPMKGKVIEAESMEEACDLLTDQQVGVKLHVYNPQLDLDLVSDGVYCGGSGEPSSYVGLRDGIMVKVERIQGKSIATVKLWYKKKFQFVRVAMSRMFYQTFPNRNDPRTIPPTLFLVDFCVPDLSIE